MPAEVEIKDDATREDVNAMVKEFMDERAELTGKKPEAETTGQTDSSKQTNTGDDRDAAGSDAAAGDERTGGEDSDEKDEKGGHDGAAGSEDWLTDEIRAELPRWITDEELSEFSSRDELDRALGLIDRAALRSGREAGEGGDEDQDSGDAGQRGRERDQKRGQDGKFHKQREDQDAKTAFKPYEIDLDLSEFDDDLGSKVKGALTGLRDHYEERMTALDERFAAVEDSSQSIRMAAVEAQFDAIVDSLGHADLFGQSGDETEKQLGARRTLFDEYNVYLTGLKTLGREGRMDKASVARVLRMVFADHISKQEQKNLTKRITKQSNMRMGVGAERPAEQDYKGPLKDHPDIQRAYKELQKAQEEA